MPRPRFALKPQDWFDTLDWLEHQLTQTAWLLDETHPVHRVGLAAVKHRVEQCRYAETPTQPDCDRLQTLLNTCLTRKDWDRLRKTLSARRRRRRERRAQASPVNLTVSHQAHLWLKQLTRAGGYATLSEALENELPDRVAELERARQQELIDQWQAHVANWPKARLIQAIERYLDQAAEDRSLATACRIAYQWYQREPDEHKADLLKERFIEDLVWNETHLKRPSARWLE